MNPGSLVFQKNTLVNKTNYKDNKINRLSVILFEFKYNNENYVCSCPITNRKQPKRGFSNTYIYIPYEILTDRKYSAIKLNSLYFYPKKEITKTGLNLSNNTLLKIYNGLLNMNIKEFVLNIEHCKIVRDNILKIKSDLEKEEQNKKKIKIISRK